MRIDRAVTLATAKTYWEAVDGLNRAAEPAPDRAEVLVLRASAYRIVDGTGLALEDIARALALELDDTEGLLERGILRRLAGDEAGARNDWLRVLALAPESPAAEARANLGKLDVRVE